MEKKKMMMMMIMIMIIRMIWFSDCCLESERIGLLQIRDNIFRNSPNERIDLSRYWGFYADCCTWERVECNSTTGHVILLDLSSIGLGPRNAFWYLNASLFLPFQQLKELYLESNGLAGCIHNEGFERLSSTLTNLEILDLRFNYFNNTILPSLSALPTSLRSLDLHGNKIDGTINISSGGEELFLKLNKLENLDLSDNQFSSSILSSIKGISSLKTLDLGYNRFKGPFYFKELDGLRNLQELHLSGNEITEFILSKDFRGPSNLSTLYLNWMRSNETDEINTLLLQSLVKLPNIKTLSLVYNNFKGQIFGEEPYDHKSNVEELFLDDSSFDQNENFLGSLSRAFPSLKLLSLMQPRISGPLSIGEGSIFGSLEHLYLSYSALENSFLKRIGNMRSLKTLSLQSCGISANIPTGFEGLCQLKHLQKLDLKDNDLNGNLPWCLANLTSLQYLDLSNNQFNGSISLSPFQSLTSLQYLDLSSNQLHGNISSSPFQSLTSLQHLDLSRNQFSGNINLANFTSLQYVNLSSNQFSGNIYLSAFQSLTSLQHLHLSNNFFQIPISFTPLFNLSQLKFLNVDKNTIYADHIEDHNLNPTFQLESLSLNGHGDVGAIPKFLYNQRNLKGVVISSVKLRGMFPYWLLENNTRLETLDLTNNSLSGPISLPNIPHVRLRFLDISHNYFNGSIPSQIGAYFPNLKSLRMSGNEFMGNIPDSLCNNIDDLFLLGISQNNLSGKIPNCIGNMSELQFLDLSNNNISGGIPKSIGNLPLLQLLDISNNNISGSLPSSFSTIFINVVKLSRNRLQGLLKGAFDNCNELRVLDLSHNNFSGSIPSFERLSRMSYLVLGNNNFEGKIPNGLCKLKQLSFLDVSHNRISGHMISCLNFTSYWTMEQDFISISLEFTVKGHTYFYEAKTASYMSGIDTSCNILTGHIPPEIGDLGNIKTLNFSHNNFTGRFPPTFSNLKEIESLDISHNNLQGTIPLQLTKLTSIAFFDVSYNNLSGPTPNEVAQFATFDESSYKGNPFLCGWPLPKNCSDQVDSPPSTTTSSTHNEESSNSFIDMEAFYASFGVAYGTVLITIVGVLCINPYWRRVWFYYVQMSIDNSYYFIIDHVPFLSRFKFPRFFRRIYRYVRD